MKSYQFSKEVWSLVPARSGSKRLKNKNLKKILNLSLVAKAIKSSRESILINRTFLSTDCHRIKKEGLKFKAEVPFLRSKKNSQNLANDFDVINEFLNKILRHEKILPKYIVLLRPTTPLRRSKVIDEAIRKFKKIKNFDSLLSVHQMSEPAHKKYFIKKDTLKPVISNFSNDQANEPAQIYPASYSANGYLDIIKTSNIIHKKNYLGKKSFPFITKKTIDIDYLLDLKIANYLAKEKLF